ncbi:type II toxin-antitoxin system VapC family toxin [Orenia marismortui]|uniref:Putative nucleic acid-binding protein n=1 Tax=Orenia marismortui TaxID=46469 RepID=A0A4R8GHL9_9FIRM|nr:PIN domain-containing protein [Orenia marismortui]TDX42354.1 putative nucleic acid-binding protein [Orenia marismortui]
MIKATIDLNVILDFLNKRKHHMEAAKILELCTEGKIKGYVCAHEITTLAYFLMKNYNDTKKVKYVLHELLDLFSTISVTESILKKSLNSKIKDYEDAVIEMSSLKNKIDYIITRNLDDFKHSGVKAISPEEFLVLYNSH